MSKRTTVLLVVLLTMVLMVVVYLYYQGNQESKINPQTDAEDTPMLIGGQRDEYGCLTPAGYSWCEASQKCIRMWEEACVGNPDYRDYKDWITYTNDPYNFELKLLHTWKDYLVTEGSYPEYKLVSFSFGEPHQPFTLIQILIYTAEQWENVSNKSSLKLLAETPERVYVCDGCCGLDGNCTGGGQFDDFQVARCREGPAILQTFKAL